mgnify:CR=1 FL=1
MLRWTQGTRTEGSSSTSSKDSGRITRDKGTRRKDIKIGRLGLKINTQKTVNKGTRNIGMGHHIKEVSSSR